jgi:rRNA maturation protein Nop10
MASRAKLSRPGKSTVQLMVSPHKALAARHRAEWAQEDNHLRQRDQELFVALRATSAAESEQAIRQYTRRRCPKCGEPLENTPSPWARMGACPRCGGIWLNKGAWEGLVGPKANG